jgi:hypothetical protein
MMSRDDKLPKSGIDIDAERHIGVEALGAGDDGAAHLSSLP